MNRWYGKRARWRTLVGSRCIVVQDDMFGDAIEVTVMEVSPKGRVKFHFPSGWEDWMDAKEYLLIERLETVGDSEGSKQ